MLRFAATAALLLAAAPALAQEQPAAAMPGQAQFQQAAQAFGQCVGTGVEGVAATVTPEAGAAAVLAACAAQRAALERTAESFIAGADIAEEQKNAAREQLRGQLAGAEAQVAAAIRQRRAAPATAQ